MSNLRKDLTRAIDSNFPAYGRCVGANGTCPHHEYWAEELPELVDAILTDLKVDEARPNATLSKEIRLRLHSLKFYESKPLAAVDDVDRVLRFLDRWEES